MSNPISCEYCLNVFSPEPSNTTLRCPVCKKEAKKAPAMKSAVTVRCKTSSKPASASAISTKPMAPSVTPLPPASNPTPKAQPILHWPVVAAAGSVAVVLVCGLIVGLAAKTTRNAGTAPEAIDAQANDQAPVQLPGGDLNLGDRIVPKPVANVLVGPPAPPPAPEVLPEPVAELPPLPEPPKPEAARVEVAKDVKPVKVDRIVMKRITDKANDEVLRRELLLVPEMGVQNLPLQSRRFMVMAPKNRKITPEEMPDFAGLPMRMGIDCQLSKESAENLQALSRKLRVHIQASSSKDATDPRPNPVALKELLMSGDEKEKINWCQSDAIPTLTQMLMAENTQMRKLLVDILSQIKGRKASVALAQRAIFDLSEEVREAAVVALNERPRDEFRTTLLEGLRYPWAPAANHAAEALAALKDIEAVPSLVKFLSEPDPRGPFASPGERTPVVREMVRINHLSNCVMCHAQATASGDLVRGRIPSPTQPLPPPVQYYDSQDGIFVRADVTYLQQDFSVPQPVTNHGPWPVNQRYDYMIRNRPVTSSEMTAIRSQQFAVQSAALQNAQPPEPQYKQRESVLFALRELTGKNVGNSAKNWQKLVNQGGNDVTP